MFKQRLKEAGIYALLFAIVTGIGFGLYWIASIMPKGTSDVITAIIVFGMLLGVAIVIIAKIWEFINWLFVEPFKNYKKNKGVR